MALYKSVFNINIFNIAVMVESRTRGHLLKLKKHRSRLDLRKYFFSERVANRWNDLDEGTVSATTINMFKNRLQCLRQLKISFYMDT